MLREREESIVTEMTNVRVGALGRDRYLYRNYPPYQRDQVWTLSDKQRLILTIMQNFPMQSFMLMKDEDNENRRIFQVVDGQQRQEAILGFLDNQYPTMDERQAVGSMMRFDPIEPGKTYDKLSFGMRNRIDDYNLHMIMFEKKDENVLEEIYLRTNMHKQLSVAERLFIRNGRARHFAMRLLNHPLWENIYEGSIRRKETFQAAIMTLAIEVCSYPLNLRTHHGTSDPMTKLIMGEYDTELTETLFNTVWNHYTQINHLFNEVHLMAKADIIPVYEAVLYLNEQGFDPLGSEKGALNLWFNQTKRGILLDRLAHKPNFGRMDFLSEQKDFWALYADPLLAIDGLVKR